MSKKLKISKETWIFFIAIALIIALFGSFIIKLLTNLLMFFVLVILIIIMVFGILWFINNKMK